MRVDSNVNDKRNTEAFGTVSYQFHKHIYARNKHVIGFLSAFGLCKRVSRF